MKTTHISDMGRFRDCSVVIKLPNPAMDGTELLADATYEAALSNMLDQILAAQATYDREQNLWILRSGNHSVVRLRQEAANLAMSICACNWLSIKFFESGDRALAKRGHEDYLRHLKKLNRRSGITKEEAALIFRYID